MGHIHNNITKIAMLLAVLIVGAMMSGCINTDKQSGEVSVDIIAPKEMEVQYPITATYIFYDDGISATMHYILYPDQTVDVIVEGISSEMLPYEVEWSRSDHESDRVTYTLENEVGETFSIVLFQKGITKVDFGDEISCSGTWK